MYKRNTDISQARSLYKVNGLFLFSKELYLTGYSYKIDMFYIYINLIYKRIH